MAGDGLRRGHRSSAADGERAARADNRRCAPRRRQRREPLRGQIPLTVDGLGPRGGGAHTPEEFVLTASLQHRAEVALAVAFAALG